MQTPEQITNETRESFPIGSLVKLSPKGAKFTARCWWERKGRVIGYGVHSAITRSILSIAAPRSVVLLVWEGRTRRRISRRHRSDLLLLPAKELGAEVRGVGGVQ